MVSWRARRSRHAVTGKLRDWLVLARASNLPTVWSDVLAGWCLGGAGNPSSLVWPVAAASLFYTAGMFLNDVVDVDFDRRHRADRPIAQGRVSRGAVLAATVLFFVVGLTFMMAAGLVPTVWAAGLIACIVLYDVLHKRFSGAPFLMAGCRLLLFLMAASTGDPGLSTLAVSGSIVLAIYIIGISAMARHESTGSIAPPWPLLLLVAPAVIVPIVFPFSLGLLVGGLVILVWVLASRRLPLPVRVSRMLAGIVLVDALLAGPMFPQLLPVFAVLFLAALAMQRFVPAT